MPLNVASQVDVTINDVVSSAANKLAVSVGTSATQISAINLNRKGLTIENKTGKTIFIGYTNTVTAINYSFSIPDNSYYEMPSPIYQGAIFGIVASGTASPQITEFV